MRCSQELVAFMQLPKANEDLEAALTAVSDKLMQWEYPGKEHLGGPGSIDEGQGGHSDEGTSRCKVRVQADS